jgi:type IV secretion system protein VirB4
MMNLAEYCRTSSRLADFLPWAALVGEGVVLNKDGSFQRTARFRGPDLDSAVPAELVAVAGRLNNAFRRLGSGWAIFVEAQRHGVGAYLSSRFPDAASALVDAERRADFEEETAHFETVELCEIADPKLPDVLPHSHRHRSARGVYDQYRQHRGPWGA